MKIYIIGSVGSGKTTLARKLSALLEIPHFETDNFVWQRQGGADVRRVESSRDGQFFSASHEDVEVCFPVLETKDGEGAVQLQAQFLDAEENVRLEPAPGKVVILKNQQQTKEFIADLVQFYI
ncbi:hypothetical protein A1A1_07924 [Planococcus antarcticus DSM 14505]|uniref:Uncharacterized protein n=1 Tax=Planococcus antarcticus DSM 14505 TaxID=1185653 RepID=A0A1C7DI83_9BACL|nr:shikimate kinase [Planococcus antarcticus]ANU10991.1 hypothetical protein BBH88_12075 [Planococcus antarcticus DSM 14505]EIM07085.1 hypothetical protein A1A1_07924 [Planococcus antarcticus DSM 14505]